MLSYDVGIVGAGVAGSSCAQILGEAGVKTDAYYREPNILIYDLLGRPSLSFLPRQHLQ